MKIIQHIKDQHSFNIGSIIVAWDIKGNTGEQPLDGYTDLIITDIVPCKHKNYSPMSYCRSCYADGQEYVMEGVGLTCAGHPGCSWEWRLKEG